MHWGWMIGFLLARYGWKDKRTIYVIVGVILWFIYICPLLK